MKKEISLKYTVEEAVHIWKCIQTSGFKSKQHEDEYKTIVVPNYKTLTGKDLPSFSTGKNNG